MDLVIFLRGLDAWFLVSLILVTLWVIEVIYGRRDIFMQGVAKGYSMAARHVQQAQDAPAAAALKSFKDFL